MDQSLITFIWVLPLAIFAVVGFFAYRAVKPFVTAVKQRARLLQNGVAAPAKVISVEPGGGSMTINGHRHAKVALTVEVYPSGGSPYRTTVNTFVSELQIAQLQPGAQVQVRHDPDDWQQVALESVGGPAAGASMGRRAGGSLLDDRGPADSGAAMGGAGAAGAGMGNAAQRSGSHLKGALIASGVLSLAIAGGVGYFVTVSAGEAEAERDQAMHEVQALAERHEREIEKKLRQAEGDAKQAALAAEGRAEVAGAGPDAAGGSCGRAAACCRAVNAEAGAAGLEACRRFEQGDLPPAACKAALDAFKATAEAHDIDCP